MATKGQQQQNLDITFKMAKYVIAGKSDCPFYAKAELLADELQSRLKDFKVHKIVIQPEKWDEWVKQTCKERNWSYNGRSPIVWRELLDRGGKGVLLGSCSDFLEMANGYYGIKSEKLTEELKNIANENKIIKDKDDEIDATRTRGSNPMKVCVTAAATSVAYHVVLELCNKKIFVDKEEIVVYLLDKKENVELLQGTCMELLDCAPAQLKEAVVTNNIETAFKDADLVIVLDGYNMSKEESEMDTYKDILEITDFSIIKKYGEAIGNVGIQDCKVLVAGGPCNIICNILIATAKNIDKRNFMALSRLVENRSKGLIAKRLNVKTSGVTNLIIWGQPGYDQIIDVNSSRVVGYDGAIWGPHIDGFSQDTKEIVHDAKWLSNQLPEELQQTLAKLKMNQRMAMPNAAAIIDQLKDIYNCTNTDQTHSLCISSEGWYGIPSGLVFSFPVKYTKSGFEVLSSLSIDEEKLAQIKELGAQLKTHCDKVLSSYNLSMSG